jgi:lipopolysaccharide transport protein LptA
VHIPKPVANLARSLASIAAVALAGGVLAQTALEIRNYRVALGHFDPPHDKQMRALLEGGKAQPQTGGLTFLSEGVKLQTFVTNGALELVVTTPECLHRKEDRTIQSTNSLRAETGDGQFLIEGIGFLFQQTNSGLFISNQVHTAILPGLLRRAGQTNAALQGDTPLEIFSREFQYDPGTGWGTYRGDVRVTGTNLGLSSDTLTLQLPHKERRLYSVASEGHVVADYSDVHATGDRAVYTVSNAFLRVTGHTAWKQGEREGRGDEMTIDRTNKVFRTVGNTWLRMPSQGMAGSSLFPDLATNAMKTAPGPPRFIEVFAAENEVRTNTAVFNREVRVVEMSGVTNRGEMLCRVLRLDFAGTNHLTGLEADGQVRIQQEDKSLKGERASFDPTNNVLTMTGAPAWQAGDRHGSGKRIEIRPDEMTVRGGAVMVLPAREFGDFAHVKSNATTKPKPALTPKEPAQIWADEYRISRKEAVFSGKVHVQHPQLDWTCEEITVHLPPPGGQAEYFAARGGVRFEIQDEKGQSVRGEGDETLYNFEVVDGITNNMVRLVGSPARLVTTNATAENNVIIWDRANDRIRTTGGQYAITGPTNSAATNGTRLPSSDFLKKSSRKNK